MQHILLETRGRLGIFGVFRVFLMVFTEILSLLLSSIYCHSAAWKCHIEHDAPQQAYFHR